MLRQKDFMVVLLRLFLGYLFFSAGMCKLTHGEFGQLMGPPLLEDSLAKYGLGLFAKVVAVSQVVCGMLLLSHRFSTLGAVMLLPMNLSILAVTISMGWTGTPYVNGFFTLLNILLLIYDWHKLKVLIVSLHCQGVRPTALDGKGGLPVAVGILGLGAAALVASGFSLLVCNGLALAFFALVCIQFFLFSGVSKLQLAAIVLVVLNMVIITIGAKLGKVQLLVFGNTLLVLLVVLASFVAAFWKQYRVTLP